ncbi:hypothetical protein CO670_15230 [Rhizobium sp. J15]|nr:hypothetical protein CO670_15230 [Rhizobium sp. J15]
MHRERFRPARIFARFSASKKSGVGTGDNKLLILYLAFAATITTRYRKTSLRMTPLSQYGNEAGCTTTMCRRIGNLRLRSRGPGANARSRLCASNVVSRRPAKAPMRI